VEIIKRQTKNDATAATLELQNQNPKTVGEVPKHKINHNQLD